MLSLRYINNNDYWAKDNNGYIEITDSVIRECFDSVPGPYENPNTLEFYNTIREMLMVVHDEDVCCLIDEVVNVMVNYFLGLEPFIEVKPYRFGGFKFRKIDENNGEIEFL